MEYYIDMTNNMIESYRRNIDDVYIGRRSFYSITYASNLGSLYSASRRLENALEVLESVDFIDKEFVGEIRLEKFEMDMLAQNTIKDIFSEEEQLYTINNDLETYIHRFRSFVSGSSVIPSEVESFGNIRVIRTVLEHLYLSFVSIGGEFVSYKALIDDSDIWLVEKTPLKILRCLPPWSDVYERLWTLEPRRHWWQYVDGYKERGRVV